MNREEIRKEVVDSGFENVAKEEGGEARINRWIQESIRELCDFKPWPFLFDKAEGATPLVVADLGHVQGVIDVGNRNELEPITINQVLLGDPTQVGVGAPEYWYTEDGTTIKITPTRAGVTLRVLYRKVPLELEDDEVPIVPVDYHDLIICRVRVKAYKWTDNFEAAAEELKDYERQRDLMVHALMKPNYDKERRQTRQGTAQDYL